MNTQTAHACYTWGVKSPLNRFGEYMPAVSDGTPTGIVGQQMDQLDDAAATTGNNLNSAR